MLPKLLRLIVCATLLHTNALYAIIQRTPLGFWNEYLCWKRCRKVHHKTPFQCKRQALICSPYVSKHYADAIAKMVERGINVKLITTNEKTGNFHAHDYFMKYAKPKSGQKASLEITIVDSSFIHAKMYLADDGFAAFGSANLTIAGMWEDVENIVTCDGVEVSNIRKGFEKILKYNGKGIANGKERGYQTISTKA